MVLSVKIFHLIPVALRDPELALYSYSRVCKYSFVSSHTESVFAWIIALPWFMTDVGRPTTTFCLYETSLGGGLPDSTSFYFTPLDGWNL